jgi:uracil-DNA glycosylase
MGNEIYQEIELIAGQIEEHLRYYREIGLTNMDGCPAPLGYDPARPHPELLAQRPSLLAQEGDSTDSRPGGSETAIVPQAGSDIDAGEVRGPAQARQERVQFNLFGEPLPPLNTEPSNMEETALRSKRESSIPTLSDLPLDASLDTIRAELGDCQRCKLHLRRTNIVFGEGNPAADLMFVGEGPGADEDASGQPFVGRAGKLLDKIIEAIGLKRGEVYIANVVKCRPPDNRTPERDEVETCQPFLFRQIKVIHPKVVVVLGAPALQCLFGAGQSITRSRGEWRDWNGIKVMATFHPAYLLRSPDKKKETWEDMKRVRDYLLSLPCP